MGRVKTVNSFNVTTLLLLAFSMQLMNFTPFILVVLFIVLLPKSSEWGKWNVGFLLPAFFAVCYYFLGKSALLSVGEKVTRSFARTLLFPAAFLAGQFWAYKNQSNMSKSIFSFIYVITVGCSIHGILNAVYNFINYGSEWPRNALNIWTGGSTSATLLAVTYIFAAIMLYIAVNYEENFRIKVFIIFTACVGVLFNFMTASRTFFYLIFLSFIIGFIVDIIDRKKINLKAVAVLLVIIMTIYLCYSMNIGGLKSWVENSALNKRLNDISVSEVGVNNVRLKSQLNIIKNMGKYLWGGKKLSSLYGSPHNLWLDCYNIAGIIPLVLLILTTIKIIISMFKTAKILEIKTKILLITTCVIMTVQFAIEPALSGLNEYLLIYFMLGGMCDQYLRVQKCERGLDKK
jgi:hypothetical protein